jgi:hypothetical protein
MVPPVTLMLIRSVGRMSVVPRLGELFTLAAGGGGGGGVLDDDVLGALGVVGSALDSGGDGSVAPVASVPDPAPDPSEPEVAAGLDDAGTVTAAEEVAAAELSLVVAAPAGEIRSGAADPWLSEQADSTSAPATSKPATAAPRGHNRVTTPTVPIRRSLPSVTAAPEAESRVPFTVHVNADETSFHSTWFRIDIDS